MDPSDQIAEIHEGNNSVSRSRGPAA